MNNDLIEKAARILVEASYALALTGAGLSVESGILKSDTVFFGEPSPADVLVACETEAAKCDCMIVAGTTASVYPAAAFPRKILRQGHPLIEVNAYESDLTPHCQVSLRGPSGIILPALVEAVERLGSL